MSHQPLRLLIIRAASLAVLVLAAGCATGDQTRAPSPATANPRAADAIYEEWFDPGAVVLPPPPAR